MQIAVVLAKPIAILISGADEIDKLQFIRERGSLEHVFQTKHLRQYVLELFWANPNGQFLNQGGRNARAVQGDRFFIFLLNKS
jgi:hypothetical protein